MAQLKPDVRGRQLRTSLSFLILAWMLLVVGGLVMIVMVVLSGKWSWAQTLPFLILLVLGITGLIARRLRPESKLARVLPDTIQGHALDQRLSRWEVLQAVLVVAVLIVLAWIAIQRKLL